jgi:hypothetical protein
MTLFSEQTSSQSWFSKMKDGPSYFGKTTPMSTPQTRMAGSFIASDKHKSNPLEKASHHKK